MSIAIVGENMSNPLKVVRLTHNSHQVRVFVWPNREDMYAALDSRDEGHKDYSGYYAGNTCIVRIAETDRSVITKRIGDIHLVLDLMGAGYFAHELQHFVTHYMDLYGVQPGDDCWWEPLSEMVGEMTSAYWTWFYENFEETHV